MKANASFHMTVALSLVILFAAVPSMAQKSCTEEPCAIDLVTGKVTGPCADGSTSFFPRPPAINDSDRDSWMETVVQVSLNDECSEVCVLLDYGPAPTGFTLNIGDSITNDGYGGNNGTGENEAELQINNDRLTLYSRSYGSGQTDRVADADLQLEAGGYKVCVSDQYASFGQPHSTASTPFGQAIYALPDPFDGNMDVFIGLNRVVHNLSGATSAGRPDTGLQRAYIRVQ